MTASASLTDWPMLLRVYLTSRGHACDRPEFRIPCYAHEDTVPSLVVKIDEGVHFCHVCKTGGGALALVEGLERCSRQQALVILKREGPAPPPPLPRPAPPKEPPARAQLDPLLARYRALLATRSAEPVLEWLAKEWGVSREVLDRYEVGIRDEPHVELACPNHYLGSLLSIKYYRPAWPLPGGGKKKRVISEPGSKHGLIGGRLLETQPRVLLTGGEKDVLVAAAAVGSSVLPVAHAGGEGAWASSPRRGSDDPSRILARAIADSCDEIYVALDANEDERGTPQAVAALARAGALGKTKVVRWPENFRAAHPKGGVAQALLDRRFGKGFFEDLLGTAEPPAPPPEDPGDEDGGSGGRRRRPEIVITNRDVCELIDEAEEYLAASGAQIYVHGRSLCRIVPGMEGVAPRIEPIPEPSLTDVLSRHISWAAWGKEDKKHADPPKKVVLGLSTRGSWCFPKIEAVVTTPTLRKDGTVLSRKGYDPASCLYLDPDGEYGRVPERPSQLEAGRALAELEEVFCDVPFRENCNRSAAIALILTLLARPAIEGPSPLFLITANNAGAGKNKLANVAGLIAHGRFPRTMPPVIDDEWRKQFTAEVCSGTAFVVLDEAQHLKSPVLASALTSERWCDRVLQATARVEGLRPVLASCGNNTSFSGDIGRRLVPVEILAPENPELRSTFRHPKLEEWVLAERSRLVVAGLTVLRAYFAAGRPPQKHLSSFGSFEGWSSLVRSALVWLGAADPCASRDRVRSDSDRGLEEVRLLLHSWRAFLGERAWTLREAEGSIRAAVERNGDDAQCAQARELLEIFASKGKGSEKRLDHHAVGCFLSKHKDRVVDGLRLVTQRDLSPMKRALWRVADVRQRTAGPEAPHDATPYGGEDGNQGTSMRDVYAPQPKTSELHDAQPYGPIDVIQTNGDVAREGVDTAPSAMGETGGWGPASIRRCVMEGAVEDPDVSRDEEDPENWQDGRE